MGAGAQKEETHKPMALGLASLQRVRSWPHARWAPKSLSKGDMGPGWGVCAQVWAAERSLAGASAEATVRRLALWGGASPTHPPPPC